MVQPGAVVTGFARGFDLHALACQLQRAAHLQLRAAVVVAGLLGLRPLAREAGAALQQRVLAGFEAQVECECGAAYAGGVAFGLAVTGVFIGALQRPVLQPHVGIGLAGLGNAKACARDALVVVQAGALHIAQRRMGKQQLARRKCGAQLLRGLHA